MLRATRVLQQAMRLALVVAVAGSASMVLAAEGATSQPISWKTDLGMFSIVVFIAVLSILWKFAWGPLSAALDGREQSLLDAHEGAQKARDEAEQLLEEHRNKLDLVQDEVREILEEARRDAQHTSQEIQNRAEQEAEETRERALRDVERARDQALQDITAQASRMVIETSSRVIQSSLNEQDHQRLIEESLAEFSASKP